MLDYMEQRLLICVCFCMSRLILYGMNLGRRRIFSMYFRAHGVIFRVTINNKHNDGPYTFIQRAGGGISEREFTE